MRAPPPTARKGLRRLGRPGAPGALGSLAPLALAAALVTAGCGEPTGVPLTVRFTPAGTLSVGVSDESGRTTPTYDWTGGAARRLSVRVVATGQLFWRVEATDLGEGFGGPVEHGLVPLGARQTADVRILDPGVEYEIVVVTVDGQEGTADFIP